MNYFRIFAKSNVIRNKQMKHIVVLVASLFIATMACAQTVNLHMKNGEVIKYNTSEIDYIDFTDSSGESDPPVADNELTILLYMPWTGSLSSEGLYPYLTENVESVCTAIEGMKGMTDYRLMLFISESYNKSKLYEITYNESRVKCEKKLLKEYSGHEYTAVKGLTDILSEVKNHATAQNYAMVLGCHGTGWTFKDSWHRYPNYAKKQPPTNSPEGESSESAQETSSFGGDSPISSPPRGSRWGGPYQNYNGVITPMHTRFFGSVSDISTFSTDIPTLAQAIANAGMKMEYILFDDCYMANVEVAYELRNVTDFLLASTSEVMAVGVPYYSMWAPLASVTPGYVDAVSAFDRFYRDYVMPYGTFSAIDCRQMDELATAMREINSKYKLSDEALHSIQVLDGFYDPIFYDMGDYLEKLCTGLVDYSYVVTLMESAVCSKCSTPQIYSFLYNSPTVIDVNTFSGITISDPSVNSVALDGKEKTSWWKATHE